MKKPGLAALLVAFALSLPAAPALSADAPPPATLPAAALPAAAPLHHPVSSKNPEARRLFDQGLFYVYAFNHDEAIRCFQEAARLDPEFALAHWGVALALGPNINLETDPPRQKAAFEAISRALSLLPKASEAERAYIRALATRYTGDPDEDKKLLANRYMEAMRALSRGYPDDPDAAALYAESIMNLRPWKLWRRDGTPAPGTEELVWVLEATLRRHPGHLGANHYYIHAVEASPHPEWALPSAARLEAMQLPAGHLVHMPSHIYLRTGDYAGAALCNEAAAAADRGYLESAGTGGVYSMMYYSHNLHFLAVAESMRGRYAAALSAAELLAAHVAPGAQAMPMLEFFLSTPELVMVRFHRWGEILALQKAENQPPLAKAYRHFARAVALAATGEPGRARAERELFREAVGSLSAEASVDLNTADEVLQVAQHYLDGAIARGAGDLKGAAESLRKGAAAEDRLNYTEPPSWWLPLREPLGGLYLKQGMFPEAEKTFREELARNPRSGRALFGLWESLKGQGKGYEAELVEMEYRAAWRDAGAGLTPDSL